ncbi:MAG: hypothetical protein GX214_00980 [Clostridiales bacterium]|nr:hypothetical protein [Clostridiales bacterium]
MKSLFKFKVKSGFTLLETILATTILSSILIIFIPLCIQNLSMQEDIEKELTYKHNVRIVLNYIEKNIRECDKLKIKYHPDKKTIEGSNDIYKTFYIDMSGNRRSNKNTLLYFYKSKNEVRINKDNENNVLAVGIKDIKVTEIIEGDLLEIEVFSNEIDYSAKTILKLRYR